MAARWRLRLTAREETQEARARAMTLIELHARRRQDDVDDNQVTPRLAALMTQQYSRGVIDNFIELYGERAAEPLARLMNDKVLTIDPDWLGHTKIRWSQRPADLA